MYFDGSSIVQGGGIGIVLKSPGKIAKCRLLGVVQWGGNMLHLSEDSSPETLPTPLQTQSTRWSGNAALHTPQSQAQASYQKPRAQGRGKKWLMTKTGGVSLEFSADHFDKCYHYAIRHLNCCNLFFFSFFSNFKLSDLSEITHPKKVLFFFPFSILVK